MFLVCFLAYINYRTYRTKSELAEKGEALRVLMPRAIKNTRVSTFNRVIDSMYPSTDDYCPTLADIYLAAKSNIYVAKSFFTVW